LGRPLAAFLGGSRAFGLGNRLSDIDLTVVYDDEVVAGEQRVRSLDGGDVLVHCELVGIGEYEPVRAMFAPATLSAATASVDADALMGRQRRVAELLHGQFLRTSPVVERLRADLPADRVAGLCAAAVATLGALSVRDAAGAVRSGDWLTAVTAAEIALEQALDAALFVAGDPYRSRKFLARRLSRQPALAPLLDDLRRPGTSYLDREGLAARTRGALLVANGVQAATLLGAGLVWTRHPAASSPGPVRSPWLTLVATDGGLRLAGAIETGVGRPAAVLWLLADGRPVPELAARFAELHGLADAAAFVETNVTALREAGAFE
jgi:hypothetical protein